MAQQPTFRAWPWVVMAVMLGFFIPAHALVQARYQYESAQFSRQWHLDKNAYRQARHEQIAFRNTREVPHPSMLYASLHLNGGRSFAPLPGSSSATGTRPAWARRAFVAPVTGELAEYLWTDAAGGRTVLVASGDQWIDVIDVPAVYPNPNLGLMGMLMISRRMAYMGLYLLWPILLFVWLSSWPRTPAQRTHRALHLLLIALAATLLAMIGPRYWRAWRLFFEDDAAAWGLIQIPLSLAMLWASRFIQTRNDGIPRCRQCRYILTGNTSGICPECGTPVSAGSSPRATSPA